MGSLQDYLRVRFDSMCNKHQSNSFVLPCEQGTVPAHKGSVPLCFSGLDKKINRIHEIFHTLGLSHPKGNSVSDGIMNYPPKQPSGNDALIISNSSFLPSIFK